MLISFRLSIRAESLHPAPPAFDAVDGPRRPVADVKGADPKVRPPDAIEKLFSELSNVKTDRNLLAGLFVEVAKYLNQDAAIEPLQG
jgi:hypothetical protein